MRMSLKVISRQRTDENEEKKWNGGKNGKSGSPILTSSWLAARWSCCIAPALVLVVAAAVAQIPSRLWWRWPVDDCCWWCSRRRLLRRSWWSSGETEPPERSAMGRSRPWSCLEYILPKVRSRSSQPLQWHHPVESPSVRWLSIRTSQCTRLLCWDVRSSRSLTQN